jgi:excisionase family DNA binding protein
MKDTPIDPELLFPPFNKTSAPLTIEEVAAVLRKDQRTIRRYARMGVIPGARQDVGKGGRWRFNRKQFQLWLEKGNR